jgi:hypothetical protein
MFFCCRGPRHHGSRCIYEGRGWCAALHLLHTMQVTLHAANALVLWRKHKEQRPDSWVSEQECCKTLRHNDAVVHNNAFLVAGACTSC